ncbi:MAG: PQQ-like beta-propeller repeat protein [Vicinamibacteria bacterium]|nr:PQQ-like beta-propeller repeat protein [Vicinamibacteria bacterium]
MSAWLLAVLLVAGDGTAWPQWGGPGRDFRVADAGVAAWGEGGPRVLWRRVLGEGFSAFVAADGKLVTLLREGDEEVALALDAATGRTLWEARWSAPFTAEYSMENGPGPHATPLIVAGRVFAVGATGRLRALDLATGRALWDHDLVAGRGGTLRVNGYAASPVAHGDTVIVSVGGPGQALVAFAQTDGREVWRAGDWRNSPASPLCVTLAGRPQVIGFFWDAVAGFDAASGAVLWSVAHPAEFGLNVSMPLAAEDGTVFVSSSYGGGSRALRLEPHGTDAGLEPALLWAHNRMRVHFGNAVRLGRTVFASSGDFASAPLLALDLDSGRTLWRERGLARASLVAIGERLLLLTEDGELVLARPSSERLEVEARASLLAAPAWTVPTVVGTRVYLRDRREALALELSRP